MCEVYRWYDFNSEWDMCVQNDISSLSQIYTNAESEEGLRPCNPTSWVPTCPIPVKSRAFALTKH